MKLIRCCACNHIERESKAPMWLILANKKAVCTECQRTIALRWVEERP